MSPLAKDLGQHMSTGVASTLIRYMAMAVPVIPSDELAIFVVQAVASAAGSGIASFVASAAASGAIKTTADDLVATLFNGIELAMRDSRGQVSAAVAQAVRA